jgi:hypothetical protein
MTADLPIIVQGSDQSGPHHPSDEVDLAFFTTMTAHELHAAVAAIRELAGLLQRVPGDASQQTALLRAIAAEATMLDMLVEDVRIAALGEHDGVPIRQRPVPVAALLAELLADRA